MRYLIFAGATYYADGGAHDLVASFGDDVPGPKVCEEAAEIFQKQVIEHGPNGAWCHVYDVEKAKIIWSLGKSFGDDK